MNKQLNSFKEIDRELSLFDQRIALFHKGVIDRNPIQGDILSLANGIKSRLRNETGLLSVLGYRLKPLHHSTKRALGRRIDRIQNMMNDLHGHRVAYI